MNIYPMVPMSREFITAAVRTEHLGTHDDGQMSFTAYHFDADPETGVPFRTTVVVASFAAGEYSEFATYSLATRLWESKLFEGRLFRSSAVKRAMDRLIKKMDNPD